MADLEQCWENFVKWTPTGFLVVACRKCGSSFLDAGLPPTRLHCCVCGTTTHFDDERFFGLRVHDPFEGMSEDQKQLFFKKLGRDFRYPFDGSLLAQKDAKEGDLPHDLFHALNSFLSEFSAISSELTSEEGRMKLLHEWESAKARLDIIIGAMTKKGS